MGYVKTAAEVAEIQAMLSPALFTIEGMSVEFETTPEFVASVLPPCFEPASNKALATTSMWQSRVCGEFESAALMVYARYGTVVGTYFLTLIVSGDMPVTFGRELWGEPKKLGSARLYRDGDTMYGYGERNGTRLIEIESTFDRDLGPQTNSGHALEITGPLSHRGELLADPVALVFSNDRRLDSVRAGMGTVTLTGTEFDPVGDVPVLSGGAALHYTGEASYEQVSRTALADGDRFLPYILGRSFDDVFQFPRPRRHRHTGQFASTT